MPSFKTMSFTAEDLTHELNVSKELLLKQLERDGVLKDAKSLCETYAVTVIESETFGSLFAKARKFIKDKLYHQVVKADVIVSANKEGEDDNEGD